MENAEEVFQSLEEFTKRRPKVIPRELEDYLNFVARTGDPLYQWPLIKNLFKEKLLNVITEFYETSPGLDIPPCPNVDIFNYETMKNCLLEKIDAFTSAPFTIQRICELLTSPRKQYGRIDKFMRAFEKNILVVSTRDPGPLRHSESENGEAPESLVNGSDSNSDYNVDVEMEDVSSWKENSDPLHRYAVQSGSSVASGPPPSETLRYASRNGPDSEVAATGSEITRVEADADASPTTDDIPESSTSDSSDSSPSDKHSSDNLDADQNDSQPATATDNDVIPERDITSNPPEPAEVAQPASSIDDKPIEEMDHESPTEALIDVQVCPKEADTCRRPPSPPEERLSPECPDMQDDSALTAQPSLERVPSPDSGSSDTSPEAESMSADNNEVSSAPLSPEKTTICDANTASSPAEMSSSLEPEVSASSEVSNDMDCGESDAIESTEDYVAVPPTEDIEPEKLEQPQENVECIVSSVDISAVETIPSESTPSPVESSGMDEKIDEPSTGENLKTVTDEPNISKTISTDEEECSKEIGDSMAESEPVAVVSAVEDTPVEVVTFAETVTSIVAVAATTTVAPATEKPSSPIPAEESVIPTEASES